MPSTCWQRRETSPVPKLLIRRCVSFPIRCFLWNSRGLFQSASVWPEVSKAVTMKLLSSADIWLRVVWYIFTDLLEEMFLPPVLVPPFLVSLTALSCAAYSYTLKKYAARSFKTSVKIYHASRRQRPIFKNAIALYLIVRVPTLYRLRFAKLSHCARSQVRRAGRSVE
jgi:hypothetical protein